jgi:hypothetical protein
MGTTLLGLAAVKMRLVPKDTCRILYAQGYGYLGLQGRFSHES